MEPLGGSENKRRNAIKSKMCAIIMTRSFSFVSGLVEYTLITSIAQHMLLEGKAAAPVNNDALGASCSNCCLHGMQHVAQLEPQ